MLFRSWTLDKFDKNIDKNVSESRSFSNSTAKRESARIRADVLRIERKWQEMSGATEYSSSSEQSKRLSPKDLKKLLQSSHIETKKEIAELVKKYEEQERAAEAGALLKEEEEQQNLRDEQLARTLQSKYDSEAHSIGGRKRHRSKSRKHKKKRTKRKSRRRRRTTNKKFI